MNLGLFVLCQNNLALFKNFASLQENEKRAWSKKIFLAIEEPFKACGALSDELTFVEKTILNINKNVYVFFYRERIVKLSEKILTEQLNNLSAKKREFSLFIEKTPREQAAQALFLSLAHSPDQLSLFQEQRTLVERSILKINPKLYCVLYKENITEIFSDIVNFLQRHHPTDPNGSTAAQATFTPADRIPVEQEASGSAPGDKEIGLLSIAEAEELKASDRSLVADEKLNMAAAQTSSELLPSELVSSGSGLVSWPNREIVWQEIECLQKEFCSQDEKKKSIFVRYRWLELEKKNDLSSERYALLSLDILKYVLDTLKLNEQELQELRNIETNGLSSTKKQRIPKYSFTQFWSLLTIAAARGRSECILDLLKAGVDPNQQDTYGNTALLWAVANAQVGSALRLLELQLSYKIDCDIADWSYDRMIPLQLAIKKGRRQPQWDELVFRLTEKTKNINYQDRHGNTALHWACLRREKVWAEKLLAHGADFQIKNKRGETPETMWEKGSKEAELLVEKCAIAISFDEAERNRQPGKCPLPFARF